MILESRPIHVRAIFANLLTAIAIYIAAAGFVHAQGQVPTGTVSGSGSGTFTYSLTFSDTSGAANPIGSIWYAWVPGSFYLPGDPITMSAPSGWTATEQNNSIQFTANSAGNDIAAGGSLSGFGFTASFSPTTLADTANSGTSVAYSTINLSGPGVTFTVEPVAAPEPSTLALGILMLALFASASGIRGGTGHRCRQPLCK